MHRNEGIDHGKIRNITDLKDAVRSYAFEKTMVKVYYHPGACEIVTPSGPGIKDHSILSATGLRVNLKVVPHCESVVADAPDKREKEHLRLKIEIEGSNTRWMMTGVNQDGVDRIARMADMSEGRLSKVLADMLEMESIVDGKHVTPPGPGIKEHSILSATGLQVNLKVVLHYEYVVADAPDKRKKQHLGIEIETEGSNTRWMMKWIGGGVDGIARVADMSKEMLKKVLADMLEMVRIVNGKARSRSGIFPRNVSL